MRYTIHITHTSMGIRVEVPVRQMEVAILDWAQANLHAPKMGKDHGRIVTEKGDGFYVHMPTIHTFIFHKTFLNRIQSILNHVGVEYKVDYEIREHHYPRAEPYRCEFANYGFEMVVTDETSRFFYQNEVVETACSDGQEQTIFAIQTGRGKTKTFQKVMVRKGVRTALIHRASYVDKWKFDCSEDPTGLQEPAEGVHVCKGVEGIYEAYQMGLNGELDAKGIKIIIFSTTSLMMFLKEYINTAHSNAVCLEKFYDVMGVGLVGCDEVHEHFYLVYLAGIMLNPPATVEMSATLTPGASKQFIGERYLERFPMNCRVSVPFIPVVDVRALYYSIENKKLVTYGSKMTPYNHKMLEKAFVKYNAHESFAEMVWDLMVKTYLKNYEVGQKALVFFATVDMCAFFTEFLQRKLAATEWDYLQVFKYNAGDSYDDFIAADIGVSTPGKAGTAIDIPGLMHAYVTIPIDDQQLNEQIAGRPRATTRWPIDPRVWFLHCNDIPKHGTYLSSRKKSLGEKVKSFQIAFSPYVIRSSNASTSYSFASQTPVRRIELSKFSPKRSKGVSRRRRRR
ncbi:putative ATP-dependent DNA helicase [Erwinia phage Wellington]|jgi:hypothetical protein|uniref:Putative ATP-dependent DNA helicase n=1 Tax=Erwinia phage Wellington TaxID=2267653 RepID=A0A345BL58_9CAUD|nr:DNA helicase [Erwinia phage Wellington]AXF51179.1 putative ATP-dependent DNA helicase [Erwinia phage Wellington]